MAVGCSFLLGGTTTGQGRIFPLNINKSRKEMGESRKEIRKIRELLRGGGRGYTYFESGRG